jgi:hypothetical protein
MNNGEGIIPGTCHYLSYSNSIYIGWTAKIVFSGENFLGLQENFFKEKKYSLQ